jgi:hypothetical protein
MRNLPSGLLIEVPKLSGVVFGSVFSGFLCLCPRANLTPPPFFGKYFQLILTGF